MTNNIIYISKGKRTIVDTEDYAWLKQWSWHYSASGYVYRNYRRTDNWRKTKSVYMHREITACPRGMEVDHINGDKLDNRKCNLRICSRRENAYNMCKKKQKFITKSRFKGVSLAKKKGMWRAYICLNKKFKSLGIYDSEEKAAIAYNKAAEKYFGKFAVLNII